MAKFIVNKSNPLKGNVRVSGAKNSVLPIMASAILTDKKCEICDVPSLKDVFIMRDILMDLGVSIQWFENSEKVEIEAAKVKKFEASYELARQMRASFLILGPLLARYGKAKIPLPGGCAIGARPVDLHLKGLTALNAKITQNNGFVEARCSRLKGNKVYLDFPSVGATENIMMAATLALGQTIIENAAIEPEIVDLANFLNSMGADIKGAGTDTIKINGKDSLNGTTHTIIPDRIEAGTFMAAAAITKGDVYIDNVVSDHIKPMIAKLGETGINVEETETGIHVFPTKKLHALDIKTLPYPGFPTDMQAQFMGLMTVAEGTSIFIETVFENRFMHVGEFKRMGADIKIESRSAVVEGVKKLQGAKVKATDLRAGAALIISSLIAEGQTEISDIYHVERGYYNIEKKLRNLGANIERIEN